MIYISNALYLEDQLIQTRRNRSLIGWNSVLRLQDISSTDIVSSEFSVANIWSPETYTYWKLPITTQVGVVTKYIELKNLTGNSVDYIGIGPHNLSNLTPAAYKQFGKVYSSYKLQYSHDAGTWLDATDEKVPANNNSIVEYFDPVYAEFWRLKLTVDTDVDGGIGELEFRIGHLKLGKILRLQRPVWKGVTPYTMGKVIEGIQGTSANGNYTGMTVTSQGMKWEIEQKNNTPEFVRDEIMPFIDHLNGIREDDGTPQGTFYGAWRPDDYPTEVVYGWKSPSQEVHPRNQSNLFMEWRCSGDAIV